MVGGFFNFLEVKKQTRSKLRVCIDEIVLWYTFPVPAAFLALLVPPMRGGWRG
jgi:hypothetical protein